jgi:hypothetical protein
VFTTDAEGLFEIYLASFPEATRQHFNCNACKRFLETYGGLVTIGEDGSTEPVFWPPQDELGTYTVAFARLRAAVKKAKVTGMFLSKDLTWGTPVTGPWCHFSVTFPHLRFLRRRSTVLTPGQEMAERREDYGIVQRALADFPLPLLEQAVALLSSEAAYRGDRVLGPAKWLRDLQKAKTENPGRPSTRNNVVWRAVALAPAGFCHPRSSVIGTVLEDLKAGLDAPAVLARFAEKMRPSNYQRATVAPTAGAIEQAEKLFADMGLAPALPRRYAQLADVPEAGRIWLQAGSKTERELAKGALFGHLAPKSSSTPGELRIPAVTMTWAKFQRDVLPTATKVEAKVPQSSARFMALVTAVDPEAPPILQWDREEARNPVSWYYAGGVDAEMRRRVEAAGGRYTDVDVRATLLWNSYTDLDLHVVGPDGHIFFADRQSRSGGWLDVDANAGGGSFARGTRTPVENIRWARGKAPLGTYNVHVHHYANGTDPARTPFVAEVEVGGQVLRFEGETTRVNQTVQIAQFERRHDGFHFGLGGRGLVPTVGNPNAWGVTAGSFVPVQAFVTSPNLWGAAPMPHHGRHVFALLEGCKDGQEGVGRGFFTESLRSELRPVRAVLEAYAAGASIEAVERPACGLGFSDQAPWDLTVRVTGPAGVATYVIDRAE